MTLQQISLSAACVVSPPPSAINKRFDQSPGIAACMLVPILEGHLTPASYKDSLSGLLVRLRMLDTHLLPPKHLHLSVLVSKVWGRGWARTGWGCFSSWGSQLGYQATSGCGMLGKGYRWVEKQREALESVGGILSLFYYRLVSPGLAQFSYFFFFPERFLRKNEKELLRVGGGGTPKKKIPQ